MGIKYICGNCGYVLYEFKKSSLGLLSPATVSMMYKGKCPQCGKQLLSPTYETWKGKIIISKR
ncbi:MAG: hypothetical protein QXJ97_12720 [Desulfurococcaceae archaeon]